MASSAGEWIQPLFLTATKLMMWMPLDEGDIGGQVNNDGQIDETICAICGTTSICMPYRVGADGSLEKATKNQKEDEFQEEEEEDEQ